MEEAKVNFESVNISKDKKECLVFFGQVMCLLYKELTEFIAENGLVRMENLNKDGHDTMVTSIYTRVAKFMNDTHTYVENNLFDIKNNRVNVTELGEDYLIDVYCTIKSRLNTL